MQRAHGVPGRDREIGGARRISSVVRIDRGNGMQLPVAVRDAREQAFGQIGRGETSLG